MRLSRGSALFLIVLVGLAVVAVLGVRALLPGEPSEDLGDEVAVEIPDGANVDDVATMLAEDDVIDSEWRFRLAARFDARANQIRAGEYTLREGMSATQVFDRFAEGPPPPPTFTVTVPEGLTVPQTLERIAEAGGSPHEVEDLEEGLVQISLPEWVPSDLPEGAQQFEGLLAPATYEFEEETPAAEILAELVRTTDDRLSGIEPEVDWEQYELLTVASLIEREVRIDEERPVVASVVANRLEDERLLQIDATVQYAQDEHQGRLLFEDLEIDSAWNTYEVEGLPPTPIAAPGRAALESAAHPANTDYRYYVVCDTETGEHAFAEHDEAHQQNVARFREIQDDGGRFCDDT
ncbi:endolytic transglycosylase MltG [Egibacter rhizosphaerae]|uniref:Endolytic murein transglycosylase n=1 Tax=Egibacter rhizosphaerae TaxID=1670831 RepID=A0A411YJW8_9ACTN|nr:endolytic transglycosylase MltG [Egibacter rhizosphaerae]QBI21499.1 endolytic transglycosylase MltG [Egibacter rhizosphaerae]